MMIKPEITSLREQIIEVLGDKLGEYKLPNQTVLPAIAVEFGVNYPPQGTQVTGLEVVVVPQVSTNVTRKIRGLEWVLNSAIVLKQWGEGTTVEAMQLIVPLLGNNVNIGARVLPDNKLGNIETLRIEFQMTFLSWG